MERDEWTCQACGDTKATLTVHHKSYRVVDGKFVDIWDYSDPDLITLCEECHSDEETSLSENKATLFFNVRECVEDSLTIDEIINLLMGMKSVLGRRVNYFDIDAIIDFVSIANKTKHPENDWFDEAIHALSIHHHKMVKVGE